MQVVQEASIRQQHEEFIVGSASLKLHAKFVNGVLDCLDRYVRATAHSDELDLVYLRLLVRCFYSLARSYATALAGFWQPSIALTRDLAGSAALLQLFKYEQDRAREWIGLSNRERSKRFKPKAVRDALSKNEGQDLGKREETYGLSSSLGAHPRPRGFQLMEIDNRTQVGPFPDNKRLCALLEELARQCGILVRAI
jgi:hypothetical protein